MAFSVLKYKAIDYIRSRGDFIFVEWIGLKWITESTGTLVTCIRIDCNTECLIRYERRSFFGESYEKFDILVQNSEV